MTYLIENLDSGLTLGTYEGSSEEEALEALARDSGYDDYQTLLDCVPASTREELKVTEVDEIEHA